MSRSDDRMMDTADVAMAALDDHRRIRRQLMLTWLLIALTALVLSIQLLVAIAQRHRQLDTFDPFKGRAVHCKPYAPERNTFRCHVGN